MDYSRISIQGNITQKWRWTNCNNIDEPPKHNVFAKERILYASTYTKFKQVRLVYDVNPWTCTMLASGCWSHSSSSTGRWLHRCVPTLSRWKMLAQILQVKEGDMPTGKASGYKTRTLCTQDAHQLHQRSLLTPIFLGTGNSLGPTFMFLFLTESTCRTTFL